MYTETRININVTLLCYVVLNSVSLSLLALLINHVRGNWVPEEFGLRSISR